jgi:hypothetical protein
MLIKKGIDNFYSDGSALERFFTFGPHQQCIHQLGGNFSCSIYAYNSPLYIVL